MNGHFNIGDVVFGNWTLVKELGEGSYGKVYEAHRVDYGTYKSAIKIITIPKNQSEVNAVRARGMDDASATMYFQGFVDKVAHEFELMSKLQGTANIVGYFDHAAIPHTDKLGWDVIIRMELLTPFYTYVLSHKIQNYDIVKLGIDMCRALEVCQKQNILHRDIKPENIFISDFGDYKLGDFGIAKTLSGTSGGTKAGTYRYMAPEIYKEQEYNFTVDIYSLGLVLYERLNRGRSPFMPIDGTIHFSDDEMSLTKRMSGQPLPAPVDADEDLAKVILKASAYLSEDRYQRPEQMRADLESILAHLPVPDPTDVIANIPVQEPVVLTPSSTGGTSDPAPSYGGTIGMYGDRPPVSTPSSGGTVGMYGDRPVVPTPSNSGTVGMYEDRLPAFGIQGTGGPNMGNDVNVPPVVTDAEPSQEGEKTSFLTTVGVFVSNVISAAKDLFQAVKDGDKTARKRVGIGGAIAVVLIAVLIIAPHLGNEKTTTVDGSDLTTTTGSTKGTKGGNTTDTSEEPHEEPVTITWSEWSEHLSATVNAENSAIEAKLQYRSTPLIRVEYGEERPEGATLFESKYGDYDEWSGWQNGYIESSEITEVETRSSSVYVPATNWSQSRPSGSNIESRQISYNNRMTTVTEYRRKAGYTTVTQYRSRTRQIIEYYYQNNAWSDYSDAPTESSESTLVNYRMQYRYAETDSNRFVTPSMSNFPVFSESYLGRFRDVNDDAWYGANNSNILRTVSELGILLPDGYMRFNPDRNITIGQVIRAAVMIQRVYNGYTGLLGENNGDYQIYADYAIENGMIRQGEFSDLTKEATRQEMAYIFYNALPETEFASKKQIDAITDMDMGYRYYDCALAMAEAGIINLNQNNEYRPEDTATRAEAASIIDAMVYPEHRSGGQ